MTKELNTCDACVDQYHKSSRDLWSDFEKESDTETANAQFAYQRHADLDRLTTSLKKHEGNPYAVHEVLTEPALLEHETLAHPFITEMAALIKTDGFIPRKTAGFYLLLMHDRIGIREWAQARKDSFGPLTEDDFDTVGSLFTYVTKSILGDFKFLSIKQLNFWKGLARVLLQFNQHALEDCVLRQCPILLDVIHKGLEGGFFGEALLLFEAVLSVLQFKFWVLDDLPFDEQFVFKCLAKKCRETESVPQTKRCLCVMANLVASCGHLSTTETTSFIQLILEFFMEEVQESSVFSREIQNVSRAYGIDLMVMAHTEKKLNHQDAKFGESAWAEPLIDLLCEQKDLEVLRFSVQVFLRVIQFCEDIRSEHVGAIFKRHIAKPNEVQGLGFWPARMWVECANKVEKLPPEVVDAVIQFSK